jgi:hypothetical protein
MIFLTNDEVIAPVGGGDVAVDIVALDAGVDYNGAFGASELIEIVEGVASVSVPGATTGGADPETSEDYLDRLTSFLTIPRRPVLPADHSTLALQVPGVGRATAYNLYYPGTALRDAVPSQAAGNYDLWTPAPPPSAGQSGVARCTTVAILADGGFAPAPELLQRVFEVLDSNREINFLNFVVAPSLAEIDVKCDVKGYTGIDSDDIVQNVKDTVGVWLSSQEWNAPPGVETGVWELDTKVRLYEAVDYINRAGGVWYCENVQLKLHASPGWTTGDITMPGLAPVPFTKPANIFVNII